MGHSAAWTRPLQDLGVFVARKSLYDDNELLTMTPWAAFVAAMLVTLVVAALIGYPSLRLRGHYLAVATLGFGAASSRPVTGRR